LNFSKLKPRLYTYIARLARFYEGYVTEL
jgi:hypothetical protein